MNFKEPYVLGVVVVHLLGLGLLVAGALDEKQTEALQKLEEWQ